MPANETQYVKINKTNICDECWKEKQTHHQMWRWILFSVSVCCASGTTPATACYLIKHVALLPQVEHTNHLNPKELLRLEFHRRKNNKAPPQFVLIDCVWKSCHSKFQLPFVFLSNIIRISLSVSALDIAGSRGGHFQLVACFPYQASTPFSFHNKSLGVTPIFFGCCTTTSR